MHLDIVLWPHPVLLTGTEPVECVDEEIRGVVGEMRRVMFELRGVGLAAPQVGVARRLVLVCPTGQPGDDEVVINPEVLSVEGSATGEEGCLSFPGIYGDVERATRAWVRYRDLDWRIREAAFESFVARVFLHEFDHLEGRVFTDRMTPTSRARAEPQLEELRQRFASSSA